MEQINDYVPLAEITKACSALAKKWDRNTANWRWGRGRCNLESRIALWAEQGFLNLYSCKPIPPSKKQRWFFIDTNSISLSSILHNKEEIICNLFFVDESDHFGTPRDRILNKLNNPKLELPKTNVRWSELYLHLNELTRLENEHPDFANSDGSGGNSLKKDTKPKKIKNPATPLAESHQERDSLPHENKRNSTSQLNEIPEPPDLRSINEKTEPARATKDDNVQPPKKKAAQELDTFLRVTQIIGNPQKGIPPIIPVSKSTWWAGVKSGRFPKPIKLSERCTVWRLTDILALQNSLANEHDGHPSK